MPVGDQLSDLFAVVVGPVSTSQLHGIFLDRLQVGGDLVHTSPSLE